MGRGYLRVEVTTGGDALPVAGASVSVHNTEGTLLYQMVTDADGGSETLMMDAPDASHTFSPDDPGPYYAAVDVTVTAPGYESVVVRGVHIYDNDTSILPVVMLPLPAGVDSARQRVLPGVPAVREITIPDNGLHSAQSRDQEGPAQSAVAPRVLSEVVIPDYITVHLGRPTASASDVRVRFADYIKNVASNEIYSTWPVAALEANVLVIISYTLNRVFTEWYPSRGYSFHITNSTSFDQNYVYGSSISQNISVVVDRLFNTYIRRQGVQEPFFASFCNGTTATCAGLSQWGSYYLAAQGQDTMAILRNYYPSDIQLVTSNNIAGIPMSYPGYTLQQGSSGEAVQRMQEYLNRIRVNYPLIPSIANPNGVFGSDTAASVRTFQQVAALSQTGVINQATWYAIVQRYVSVTKLADLESEGLRIGIGSTPPNVVLRQGSSGRDVVQLQFLLNMISAFYPAVPPVLQDSSFGAGTTTSVKAFQRQFGLTADGIVGPSTWNKLYEVYRGIEDTTDIPTDTAPPYPGTLLRIDSRGEDVRLMQQYLNVIAKGQPSLPRLGEDGIFGPVTQSAVREFQRLFGLSQDGIIGQQTWDAIVREYAKADATANLPPYPGTLLREGSRGEDVRFMQQYLNAISTGVPAVPNTGTPDGIFGARTKASVQAFQRQAGLSADGIIGPLTWDAISRAYAGL